MRRLSFSLSLIAVLLFCLPTIAGAQEEEESTSFVYATYFECDVSKQWRADEITKNVYAPVYDAAVEEGILSSWGWLAHHTGGKWRRLMYQTAPTVDALMDVPDAVAPKIKEASPNADREFREICGVHDDYIWEAAIGSRGAGLIPQERGKVGISVYFYCDMSKEERADEIVEEACADLQQPRREGQYRLLGLAQARLRRQVAPRRHHDRHRRKVPPRRPQRDLQRGQ
jgi:hypothetical protein